MDKWLKQFVKSNETVDELIVIHDKICFIEYICNITCGVDEGQQTRLFTTDFFSDKLFSEPTL